MKFLLFHKLKPYANYVGGIVLLCFLAAAFLVTMFYFHEEWDEPTVIEVKPQINCTIVTAIFVNENLTSGTDEFANVSMLLLEMRLPMIIFTNGHFNDLIFEKRESILMENQTKILNMTLESLPLYANYSFIDQILTEEQLLVGWKEDWDLEVDDQPKFRSAEFSIVVNSKSYFLSNASKENPFNTSFFAWFDSDFGNGKAELFPPNFDWTPKFPENQISVLKLTPFNESISWGDKGTLHRKNARVVSTEFIGADSSAIEPFHQMYQKKLLDDAVVNRAVDDPQTVLIESIKEKNELFNVVQAGWFSVFQLF